MVVDAASGRRIWSHREDVPMRAASLVKLATALAALDVLGADHTVRTRVDRGATTRQIVLVGRGDALLTTAALGRLATATTRDLRNRGVTRVEVLVDDSLFPAPSPAPGWLKSYHPHEVAPVRPLIVDQHEVMDTALDAGQVFAAAMKARGIGVTSVRRGVRPRGAATIAGVESPPVLDWVERMLLRSDNDIAETLARLTAIDVGYPATWEGVNRMQATVLARYGITGMTLYDGSGLSRSDRVTARAVVTLLRTVRARRALRPVLSALPLAGRTGTLTAARGRFDTRPSSCAAGRVRAKSGALRDTVSLAGTAATVEGDDSLFVFVVAGQPSTLTVRRAVDGLAATVVGCW